MKKNTLMRIASVLLVVVLATTCVISGTFAKYVTTANGGDNARVAKWGIVMDSTGTATFADTYKVGENIDVDSVDGADVVAPGTSGSATYQVTGAPETDYRISFTGTALTEEVFLAEGTYTYSNANSDQVYNAAMTQEVEDRYNPIKYYITIDTDEKGAIEGNKFEEGVKSDAYATLEAALADLVATTILYQSNVDASLTVTIEWVWAFDANEDANQNDAYDTILGDLEAGNADLADGDAEDGINWNLDIVYNIQMTATQVNA